MTLAIAIAGAAAVFAILISAHSRQEVLSQTISQNQQTAEVIRRSIRYAMLQNHREQVAQIIEAVSRTRGIEKIRIFDKEGEIITSTLPSEIGTRVDKAAEACFHCHAAGRPLQQLPGTRPPPDLPLARRAPDPRHHRRHPQRAGLLDRGLPRPPGVGDRARRARRRLLARRLRRQREQRPARRGRAHGRAGDRDLHSRSPSWSTGWSTSPSATSRPAPASSPPGTART